MVCLKKQLMGKQMKQFLKAYRRLDPKMKLQDSQGLGELRRFVFEQEEFKEIEKTTVAYSSYNIQNLGEKASNVALLMVQDGTISNLAYSMTDIIRAGQLNDIELKKSSVDNLKIQSISVISKFNTVAVEYGLANVTDALSSKRQLDEARIAAEKFEQQKKILDINISKISAIDRYAKVHLELLNRFVPIMEEYVPWSTQIIKSKDNFLRLGRIREEKFTEKEIEILAFTLSLAGAVKAVIDSPIISKNGEVYNGSRKEFESAQGAIQKFERECIELKS